MIFYNKKPLMAIQHCHGVTSRFGPATCVLWYTVDLRERKQIPKEGGRKGGRKGKETEGRLEQRKVMRVMDTMHM